MPIRAREGNRPDRRFLAAEETTAAEREALVERVRYVGSANHKLRPGDYGFVPTSNPRPSKSPCDALRSVLFEEASTLFRQGILLGMVSRFDAEEVPKYVWSVDGDGDVYEAKTKAGGETDYHGYRLGDDDSAMGDYVRKEWKRRCR